MQTTSQPSRAGSDVDPFRAIFEAAADAMLLTDDDRRYTDANPAACELLGRSNEELLGLRIEDVSPAGTDVDTAWATFLRQGRMAGEYTLLRPDGSQVEVEFRAQASVLPGRHLSILRDVTERKRAERERDALYQRLREAHDQQRRVALTLQRAMLPSLTRIPGLDVAARYLPAADITSVGGDWYDVIDLGADRIAIVIGDVMGHGLGAAGVMGQLRSALAAALHADDRPARTLAIADAYARSGPEPMTATVMLGVVDLARGTLTYSSAGHPPALLLGDGCRFLDGATAPPLAATYEVEQRPEVSVDLPDGALLVLFTDGLVERRHEDIDDGLARLADVTQRLPSRRPEAVADAILDALVPGDSATEDDVALLVAAIDVRA